MLHQRLCDENQTIKILAVLSYQCTLLRPYKNKKYHLDLTAIAKCNRFCFPTYKSLKRKQLISSFSALQLKTFQYLC